MNRYLLYILFIAIGIFELHGSQSNSKSETILCEHHIYIFGSGNDTPKQRMTYKQLNDCCNILLQNRPLTESLDNVYQSKKLFLTDNYSWEKIGVENDPGQYQHANPKSGRIRWHQIYAQSTPSEQTYTKAASPTTKQLQETKKQLQIKSAQLKKEYEEALEKQRSLLSQEILCIIKPVAALVQINKREMQHEQYLENLQKRSKDLKTTSDKLRNQIPFDIQEYLKKNPETWKSLKLLAHVEEQEAAFDHEKMCEQQAYESLQQTKLKEQEQLQTAWLAFDQAAVSNAALAQLAYTQKRQPQTIASTECTNVNFTNEEIARFICDYKINSILANTISHEEQEILASTYPTAIPQCIQGAPAQQLFLHNPSIALIETAKKILLQKALDNKRKLLIEQGATIVATDVKLTPEEHEECLRIWHISEMLKKIATEKQLNDITNRFPQYTLKFITDDSTKPKSHDYDNQEIVLLDSNHEISSDSEHKTSEPSTSPHMPTSTIARSSGWGFSSLMSWGQ